MYRKRRKQTCEICGKKTHYLGLFEGKHVCGKCENKLKQENMLSEKYRNSSLF